MLAAEGCFRAWHLASHRQQIQATAGGHGRKLHSAACEARMHRGQGSEWRRHKAMFSHVAQAGSPSGRACPPLP